MYDLKVCPDAPNTASIHRLPGWDESGNWICQQKVDGFRMEIDFHPDKIVFVSRHSKVYTSEMSDEILAACQELRHLVPNNSRIDAEWRSRRSCSVQLDLPQRMFLFDIIRWNGRWLCNSPYQERWHKLCEMMARFGPSHDAPVILAEMAEPGHFTEFFEAQKSIPWSEGVVVKHKKSLLVSDHKSRDNPQWFKVKYRGGVDGEVKGAR